MKLTIELDLPALTEEQVASLPFLLDLVLSDLDLALHNIQHIAPECSLKGARVLELHVPDSTTATT